MISASASKIREVRTSVKRDGSSFKNRRSVSVDTRSRGSYVPERKRPSSDERKSGSRHLDVFNRWSGARKSSINLVDAKRKDARPLADKQYQKRKMADLFLFLEENGFGYQIKDSKYTTLSKKDFENIFQFLYNTLDPSYQVKRFDEEAPKILKNLGYPYTVSKQAFMYVARTQWASLLGVLIWLMDLSKFAMRLNINSIFDSNEGDEKAQMHFILLRFICQCYHSGQDNEEAENDVFRQLLMTSLMPENIEELFTKNEKKKEKLTSIENELKEMEELTEEKATHDAEIQKIEEFNIRMKAHYQQKQEQCEKLIEELERKETILKELQDKVSHKQEAYDAQGFDGKKQLGYFEMQKQELTEKLEKKQAVLKELQDKIWEAEIQYRNNLDKVNSASESFEELHSKVIEETRTILQSVQSLKIPQIQKFCNSFNHDLPSWEIPPFTETPDWKIHRDNVLESMSNRVKSMSEIFKRIYSSQSEKLSEVQMKISDVSVRVKLFSVHETQMEHDYTSKEKQAIEELSALEDQCNKIMNSVIALQAEKTKLEKELKELSNEVKIMEKFRKQKEKELNDYLVEQRQILAYCSRTEQEVSEKNMQYGEEIYQKLEEVIMLEK